MKSKPMLCIAMMLLLQNCEKSLDKQYEKSTDESGEQKVIDAENELKWKVPEDEDQTRKVIEVLNRWSEGKYDHFYHGGGTQSGAKRDAIGICYDTPDGTIVFHIPTHKTKDKLPDREDVRFSFYINGVDSIDDIFSPPRISHSIKQDEELKNTFVKFLKKMKNGNDEERSCWSLITDFYIEN
jgi:hypothetical protein